MIRFRDASSVDETRIPVTRANLFTASDGKREELFAQSLEVIIVTKELHVKVLYETFI